MRASNIETLATAGDSHTQDPGRHQAMNENPNALTVEDCATLTEALRTWESTRLDDAAAIMAPKVPTILEESKSPEEFGAKMNALLAETKSKVDATLHVRRERSVLLQAKLIGLRDRLRVEEVCRGGDGGS